MKVTIKKLVPESVAFHKLRGGEFYINAFDRDVDDPSIRMKLNAAVDNGGFVIRERNGQYGAAIHNCVVLGGPTHGCLGACNQHEMVYRVKVEMIAEYIY